MIYGTRMEDRLNMEVTSGQRRKVLSNLSGVDTERVGKRNSPLGRLEQIMFQRERKKLFQT